ncbi:MAG TPA: BON domain-containing protein [Gemmataceae bacterium]|nr:BON domain-containing protein [Gemmataceae bacterium]
MFPQDPFTGNRTFSETAAATVQQVIALRAESRLRYQPHRALKNIRCECADGVLTLRDRLPTHYLKQIAQAVVAGTEGIERIDNRIEVIGPGR